MCIRDRCYPGKDTTYVVDFVNDPADILAAFKVYYSTAELSGVTDPHTRVRHFSRAKRINGACVAIKTRSWRAAKKRL